MKKIFALLLALILCLSLVACANDAGNGGPSDESPSASVPADGPGGNEPSNEPAGPTGGDGAAFDAYTRPRVVDAPVVGFLTAVSSDEAHIRAVHQAEIEAAHRGWELNVVEYTDDEDCVSCLTSLVAQDVDAIVLHSITNVEAKVGLIQQAREAGIGVYSLDSGMDDGLIMNVCAANGIAGLELFYQLGADYNWDADFTILYLGVVTPMTERLEPLRALLNSSSVYPNMTLLDEQDLADYLPAPQTYEFEYTKTWIQKYGDELDIVFCGSDGMCASVNEAASTLGASNLTAVGFDGSSSSFAYLRNPDSVTRYIYAQPMELYTHTVFESIAAIQAQGLNPGDAGCNIEKSGENIFIEGTIVTKETVPEIGTTFHEAFNYYDAGDADAWWTWSESGGATTITDGN